MQKNICISDFKYVDSFVGKKWKKLKSGSVFITGGTGIIGKWLLATIKYENEERHLNLKVTVLSRNPKKFRTEYPHLCGNHVRWLKGDIKTFKLKKGMKYDYVIHGATDIQKINKPIETLLTCIIGTVNLFRQISSCGCKNILVLSSGAIYGKPKLLNNKINEFMFGHIDPLDLNSAYAEGKKVSELISFCFSDLKSLKVTVARCFAMVGPHLPLNAHFAIGNFIRDAKTGKSVVIKGDGTSVRSYLYLSDVVARLWLLLLIGKQKAYNIGSPKPISLFKLARYVISALKSRSKIIKKNKVFKNIHSSSYVPNISLFEDDFGKSSFIPLKVAIKKTAKWYFPDNQ